jgi:2'-5' RNA ligase
MTTPSEKPVRLFIAADPGEAVRAELIRLQGRLERQLAGTPFKIRWVGQEAMHLTFLFLGDQPAGRAEELFRITEKAALKFPKFGMKLAAAGCFGRPNAPRVLWIGLDAPPALFALQAELAGALEIKDNGLFHPHLTLGRVRAGRGPEVFHALRALPVQPVPFELTSLELIRSELTPVGPRHTLLGTAPLASSCSSA